MSNNNGFGLAEVKREGMLFGYDSILRSKKHPRYYRWSYLERNIPNDIHDYINDVIDEQIKQYLILHPEEKNEK